MFSSDSVLETPKTPSAADEPITETFIFHTKDGVSLKDLTSNSSEVQKFVELTKVIKTQPIVAQFWGPQVEDPKVFLWYIGN